MNPAVMCNQTIDLDPYLTSLSLTYYAMYNIIEIST